MPRELREVTASWLAGALGVGVGARVVGFSAEAIGEGTGFMSQLYRLRLAYAGDDAGLPISVILKMPSTDPLMRTYFDRLGQNQREVQFYRRGVADGLLETPRGYYCAADPATGDSALLLEDLGEARQGDSVAGCSALEARTAMERIAAFHAAWWDSPALDGLDWMPRKDAESAFYEEIYADAWRSFIGKAGGGMPPGLRALGDRLAGAVGAIKARLSAPPRTILHGDYRLDNCFFPAAEGSPPLTVIDWEFCALGRGPYDAAAFISEAFPTERRRAEEMGLLRTYHAALEANGVTGYSFQACVEDYRLSMLEVLVFWIVTGGYCVYEGERATAYLHNSLARFEAAIADLRCEELLAAG